MPIYPLYGMLSPCYQQEEKEVPTNPQGLFTKATEAALIEQSKNLQIKLLKK